MQSDCITFIRHYTASAAEGGAVALAMYGRQHDGIRPGPSSDFRGVQVRARSSSHYCFPSVNLQTILCSFASSICTQSISNYLVLSPGSRNFGKFQLPSQRWNQSRQPNNSFFHCTNILLIVIKTIFQADRILYPKAYFLGTVLYSGDESHLYKCQIHVFPLRPSLLLSSAFCPSNHCRILQDLTATRRRRVGVTSETVISHTNGA